MGARGPLPKTSHLRAVENDERTTPAKPTPTATKCPKMPPGLDDGSKREWRRTAPVLWKLGLLTELDRLTLAIYCQTASRYERYTETLARDGETFENESGMIRAHPYVAMRDNSLKELRMLIKEFGLSPNARARMTLPDQPTNEIDEFEAMLDD